MKFKSIVIVCVFILSSILTTINVNADSEIIEPEITNSDKVIEDKDKVDNQEIQEDFEEIEEESKVTNKEEVTEQNFTEIEEPSIKSNQNEEELPKEPDSSEDDDKVETETNEKKMDGEIKNTEKSQAKLLMSVVEESSTSRLGHLRKTAKIYPDLENQSEFHQATDGYTNAVYYVKKQAQFEGEKYYLISTKPSSKEGVVGWVKESELDSHSHQTVDAKNKTFYVKGTGSAYSKAWGGSRDLVYSNLSSHSGATFQVNLTEKVGSSIWYRGKLDGKTAWIHESYLTTIKELSTSRLGHLRKTAKIYSDLENQSEFYQATDGYTNRVYYVKKQAQFEGEKFYLISTKPSSKEGVVGWVKESELDSHSHQTVDAKNKTFYVKGTGSAYSKAWGGSRDLVYSNLSSHSGATFQVNLTEKVGNNIWYRGKLNGKTAWVHESYVVTYIYDLTLNQALNIQMTAGPQTTNNYDTYVSKKYINSNKEVTADVLNVRGGPGSNYWVVGQLSYGKKVTVLKETNGWYQIEFTKNHQFVNASSDDVKYYLDPRNFVNDPKQRFQFLDLSKPSGVTKTELNKFLQGKGILSGQGQAFIDAGKNEGINDIYLVSHALLETGNGSSTLAKGVKYNGKTVYNMYGYGAYDSCPITCGAMTAYNEGWTTPYKAIVGGAKYIGNSYIKSGLNTLYKMRWNPGAMATTNRYGKQYATDIGWAAKQVNTMYKLYEDIGSYSLELDIPVYK
ncbi:N-acetylglucosaminidase [Oceanobacillus picturae]|uniref:N-acetylglucosaminidase n=1 Tax=Oceanobacillus picturae TaxID=171693 RepID=UPI000E69E746|nr:N-acetylglucosaminidase [Oceanobacillus picturae]RIU94908.1 mannosyl-glycoprotein endo-beta-N-acetylglucosamidase [Oceanobacillus picturae]